MSKKDKIYIVLIAGIIAVLGIFVFFFKNSYSLKTDKIIAAELPHLDKDNIDEIISYLKSNEINTAIVESENLSNKYVKKLKNNKIQIFIRLSSDSDFGKIIKNYRPQAVVVDENTNLTLNGKYNIFVESNSGIPIGDYSGYILKNVSSAEYANYKSFTDKTILLHYSDEDMWDDIFYLANFGDVDGAVVCNLSDDMRPIATGLFYKNDNLPKFDFNVSNEFAVTYPSSDLTTYYKGIFITGTGQENGQIDINGKIYNSQSDGTFGIYYELDKGKNDIKISQNGIEYNFAITRREYSSIATEKELPWDDTKELEKGAVVKTSGENLISILADKDDDSNIVAGLPSDIPLIVFESVETERNGKKTWAYLLQNGCYVLALKTIETEYVSELYDDDFSGKEFFIPVKINNVISENIRNDEVITFDTTGKTAVISDFSGRQLKLTFFNSSIENISLPESKFYKSYQIDSAGNMVNIVFDLTDTNSLWGYEVKISEENVELYLKSAPEINGGSQILNGVTVMLDAGHGGYDTGAVGVAGGNGPVEKMLNLATATALKELLEDNGAKVIMTRNDDEFLSLEERRSQIDNLKPDIFVAIHHNSMDYSYNSEKAKGCEAYYFTDISKNLAEEMCKSVAESTDRVNRGAQYGYYYVTRTNICPAILMEYSFIINAEEYSKTYTDEYINKSAFGSFKAILKILDRKNEI